VSRSFSHLSPAVRPAEPDGGPRSFESETLSGTVLLDDARFDRCRFRNAVLVYAGGAPPRIENCGFEDVTFQFQGAAARTLGLLQAMSAPSSGLRDVFKASFPRLFGH
jgi:hypothetical protein